MSLRPDTMPAIFIKKSGRKKSHANIPHGSWKVAYADFVTAMMAFFLLMWLVNITTEDQKEKMSEYFNSFEGNDETNEVEIEAGLITIIDGGRVGGELSEEETIKENNEKELDLVSVDVEAFIEDFGVSSWDTIEISRERYDELVKTSENFEKQKTKIEVVKDVFIGEEIDIKSNDTTFDTLKKLKESEVFSDIKDQIIIKKSESEIIIELIDLNDSSMFKLGSSILEPSAKKIILEISKVLSGIPNGIVITGHTDAKKYRSKSSGYSNWELSSDRANAARRAIILGGVQAIQIKKVEGRSSTDLAIKDDPMAAENRRVQIKIMSF
jgi:chemotaxis protein MotB